MRLCIDVTDDEVAHLAALRRVIEGFDTPPARPSAVLLHKLSLAAAGQGGTRPATAGPAGSHTLPGEPCRESCPPPGNRAGTEGESSPQGPGSTLATGPAPRGPVAATSQPSPPAALAGGLLGGAVSMAAISIVTAFALGGLVAVIWLLGQIG